MKFGLLYEMEMHPELGCSESDVYWQAIEQVKLAEEVGFDYVWCVEHHFLEGFSHSSAPEIFLTAVAQHTSRIRIGHGVVLLPIPFNHPARVAERTATLDILCKGRLEVGTGRSITMEELGGFGIDPDDSRPMWEEAVRLIPRMETENEFPGFDRRRAEQAKDFTNLEVRDKLIHNLVERAVICAGDPETCARIVGQYQEQGIDQFIGNVQLANLSHDDVMESVRLFGTQVIPRFS